jgi:hypothetical protein
MRWDRVIDRKSCAYEGGGIVVVREKGNTFI